MAAAGEVWLRAPGAARSAATILGLPQERCGDDQEKAIQDAEESCKDDGRLASSKETAHLLGGPQAEAERSAEITKCISLVIVTLQTSIGIMMIKYSQAKRTHAVPYLTTTAVVLAEMLKTVTSFLLVARDEGGLIEAARAVWAMIATAPLEVLKAAVPSLVYCVHNNLTFYSLSKISAPVQQVLYQMKIVTTAGLGVLILGRKLSLEKWNACFMLAVGVAMVQWPRSSEEPEATQGHTSAIFSSNHVKGVLAILFSCMTSGFAGVYSEKMLRQSNITIWMRNVQFGFFGTLTGLAVAFETEGDAIMHNGFFQGYSRVVWSVIFMNAFGGLMCAIMLKYAGATVGCFSTATSIILTDILSWALLGDVTFDALFVTGTVLVVMSVLLFGLGLPQRVYNRLCPRSAEASPTLSP